MAHSGMLGTTVGHGGQNPVLALAELAWVSLPQ